jgi:uncharacterized protein YbjT (DUF2867 family)
MESKRTVLISGASGHTGLATLDALNKFFKGRLNVRAGFRDVTKAEAIKEMCPDVDLVLLDALDASTFKEAFTGVDVFMIVVPTAQDCEKQDYAFAKQFYEIEQTVRSLGLNWTIIRMPFFQDDALFETEIIKRENKFYFPIHSDAMWNPVAIKDVGEACAYILVEPEKHVNQLYNLTGPSMVSCRQLCEVLSQKLGAQIEHVNPSDDQARQAFCGLGFEPWFAEGVVELARKYERDEVTSMKKESDFVKITGHKGTSFDRLIDSCLDKFM